MHKSPATFVLLSICFPALAYASAQGGGSDGNNPAANVSPAGAATTAVSIPPAGPSSAPSTAAAPSSAGSSYILGPEDQITVRVFAADDIPDKPLQIDNNGVVTLPMIGQVHAAGLTVEELEDELTTKYKKYFKEPQVTVQVTEFHSQPVSVAGNVNTPGVVQLRGNRNLMEVIGMAGGLRADAGDSVLITRNLSEGPIPVPGAFTDPSGKYSVAHIDVRKVMDGKDPEGNILIKPHDVITVPRARMIYVLGSVGKPGGYVLTENETMSVTQAIALAGGWSTTAGISSARVLRADGGPEREQIPANIKKMMENKAPDVQLRPDDILYVPNSKGKIVGLRALETSIALGTGILIWR